MNSKQVLVEENQEMYLDELFRDAVIHPPSNVKIKFPSWCHDLNDLHHYMFPELSIIYDQCRRSDKRHVIDLSSSFTFVSSASVRVDHHNSDANRERLNCGGNTRSKGFGLNYNNPPNALGTSSSCYTSYSPAARVGANDELRETTSINRYSGLGCMASNVKVTSLKQENGDRSVAGDNGHRDPFTTVPVMMSSNSSPWMCGTYTQGSSLRQSFFSSPIIHLTDQRGTRSIMLEPEELSGSTNSGFFSHFKSALCRLLSDPFSTNCTPKKIVHAFPPREKGKGEESVFSSDINTNASLRSAQSRDSFFSAAPSAYQVQQKRHSMSHTIPLVGTTRISLMEWLQRGQSGLDDQVQERAEPFFSSLTPSTDLFSRTALSLEQLPSPLPIVEVFPLFDDTVLSILRDHFLLFVYDHLLLSAQLLLGEHHKDFEKEIYKVYQPVLRISLEQHVSSLENLVRPFAGVRDTSTSKSNIDSPVHARNSLRNSVKFKCINRHILEKVLSSASCSSELSERFNLLLLLIDDEVDRDERGVTYMGNAHSSEPHDPTYPLCVRAALFSGCLLPLYHLFPGESTFRFTTKDIQFCVKAMADLLDISDDILPFCHLHAQLISTSIAETRQHQCVHLRMMAKSVNNLGKTQVPGGFKLSTKGNPCSIPHDKDMKDSGKICAKCKYCYYVFHESFAIAMTAMPWLETLMETKEAAVSIMALFVESCIALPSPLLSSSTRLLGRRIYPIFYESSDFLVSFLAVFLSMGTMRQFQTLISQFPPPETSGSVENHLNRALQLLQKEDSICYYSKVLSRTVSNFKSLLLPCMMQMGVSILLLDWGVLVPMSRSKLLTGEDFFSGSVTRVVVPELELLHSISLPSSFVANVNTFMTFLCRVISTDKDSKTGLADDRVTDGVNRIERCSLTPSARPNEDNLTMSHMLRTFSTSFLSILSHMIAQWDRQQLASLMDSARSSVPVWDRMNWIAETSLPAITALMLTWLPPVSAIPVPLGCAAVDQHFRRIDATVELFMRVVERTHVPCSAPMPFDPDFFPSLSLEITQSPKLYRPTPTGAAPPGYIHSEWAIYYLQKGEEGRKEEAKKKSKGKEKLGIRNRQSGGHVFKRNTNSDSNRSSTTTPQDNGVDDLQSVVDRLRLLIKISAEIRRFARETTEVLHNVERVTGNKNIVETASRRWNPLLDRVELTVFRMFHYLAFLALSTDDISPSIETKCSSPVTSLQSTVSSPASYPVRGAPRSPSPYRVPGGSVLCLLQMYMTAECRVTAVKRRWYNPSTRRIEIKDLKSCPRTDPKLMMKDIATLTERVLLERFRPLFLGVITEENSGDQRIWGVFQLLVGSYLLAALYYQTVSGKNVYYTREDVEGISFDLRFMTNWLREISSSACSTFSLQNVRREDYGTVAIRRRVLQDIRVMLVELQYLVRHVMINSSRRLVHGGNGIPPLESLPETASDTPWSKYMLRRILDRRPDNVARTAAAAAAVFPLRPRRGRTFLSKVASFFSEKL